MAFLLFFYLNFVGNFFLVVMVFFLLFLVRICIVSGCVGVSGKPLLRYLYFLLILWLVVSFCVLCAVLVWWVLKLTSFFLRCFYVVLCL